MEEVSLSPQKDKEAMDLVDLFLADFSALPSDVRDQYQSLGQQGELQHDLNQDQSIEQNDQPAISHQPNASVVPTSLTRNHRAIRPSKRFIRNLGRRNAEKLIQIIKDIAQDKTYTVSEKVKLIGSVGSFGTNIRHRKSRISAEDKQRVIDVFDKETHCYAEIARKTKVNRHSIPRIVQQMLKERAAKDQ